MSTENTLLASCSSVFLTGAEELTPARQSDCENSSMTADSQSVTTGGLFPRAWCFHAVVALLPGAAFPLFMQAGASENSGLTHRPPHVPGQIVLIILIKKSSWSVRQCFDIEEMMKLLNIQAVISQSFLVHRNP